MLDMSQEGIERQFPAYLTDDQKALLSEELKAFRSPKFPYFTSMYPGDLLQGDGWSGFSVFDMRLSEVKRTRGIVLSNSCDISLENKRDFPPRVAFAPLIPLSAYENALANSGIRAEAVEAKLQAIRDQDVTSIFYLRKGGELEGDHIALFDAVSNVPLDLLSATERRRKLFTLSQGASYLFTLKLSVHFCRFHDKVVRYGGGLATA
ncbi:hypothetical protein [Pandoraea sputorum]|uniref:hypothetical protein n=1 Tax=Pandoraea sputorum TaxID=93222 RepID=UPI002AF6A058|nr:hypothetical protein [Pandoraea sputorum]